MSSFTIKRIYINNFKLIDQLDLNWNEGHLIVLDGPNGFGKTTIFDAIELALTGKIDRIKKPEDARVRFNDMLFNNDPSKDILIKVQFAIHDKSIIIAKTLPTSKKLTGVERQPGRWDIFDTHKLESFESPLNEENKISQKEINNFFGIYELERMYSLFYYIQQEENTSFLKRPGKERMMEISRLFDTKVEEDEKKVFQEAVRLLEKDKKNLENDISVITERLKSYKILEGISKKDEVTYEALLSEFSDKLWDRVDIDVTNREIRDTYINELLEIEDFINNFSEYKKALVNSHLTKYIENKALLTHTINGFLFLERYQGIKLLREKEKQIRFFVDQMQEFRKNIFNINYDDLQQKFYKDLNVNLVKNKVEIIKVQSQSTSQLSKIVSEINQTRQKLLDQMNLFHSYNGTSSKNCPFCGQDWKTYNELLDEFEIKKDYFVSLYDESTGILENELEDLFKNHILPALEWLNNYLSNSDNCINETFFRQIEDAHRRENEIRKFVECCSQNEFDPLPYLNNKYNIPTENLATLVDRFALKLNSIKLKVKDGYEYYEEKFDTFQTIYKDAFKEDEKNVEKLTPEMIRRKIQYIDYQYYYQTQTKKVKDEESITKHKLKLKNLKLKIDKLKNLIKIYDSSIKKHWKKIMIDIEIPFYIYSGKIIQNYQRGLGIFIKEKEEAESIVFVSDSNSDHDALNYLSSGQLSALVISFTFALNKVYGNKNLGTILIDDPVQTMDEINMASFTELLRNEFSHKQIVISTHEEDVSRYLQYKFRKYGLNSLNFNMREES